MTLAAANLSAQERSAVYTNLLNPFVYNPSLAGSTESIHAILNARGMIGGIDGSSRSYNFGISMPVANGTGLGLKMISVSAGAFQTVNAEGAYSKQVKFNNQHSVTFGLSAGFAQTNLRSEILNGQVDLSDKALSSANLNTMQFTSGAGITYKYEKKLEVGAALPALITGGRPISYMAVVNAGWNFYCGSKREWKLKPAVNYFNLESSPAMYDGLLTGSWNDVLSLTAGYRTNGSLIASAGLNLKTIAIRYAYYSHMGGLQSLAPAQNEIAISFWFNKPRKATKPGSELVSDDVIQDEIDRLNDRLNGLINVEKTNPGLVNMKKEVTKLNRDLEKILGRYKITNNQQIEKIKALQNTIESIIARYND